MRAALWLVGLFGAAVAVALFVGNHQGTVTVFWPPWRVDLSLNLVVVGLLGGFVLLHAALRATSALLALPRQARRWRQQQKERAMHEALLQALSYLLAGRFLRARKASLSALTQAQSLADSGVQIPHNQQLRAFAHLVAADCSHALQDSNERETHWQQALAELPAGSSPQAQGLREGLVIRAARWSLDERDSQGALQHLHTLPHGAARRTAALRIKLKASRLVGHTQTAMETARLLGKHRAFSAAAAQTLVRGLALELISQANDAPALQQVWQSLDATERAMPELALHAAQRLLKLDGESAVARQWLLPVWERMEHHKLPDAQALRLVQTLEMGLDAVDNAWLARIEAAQQAQPRNARLSYLAAAVCLQRQLWGKAQQLFSQAAQHLEDASLRASAWRHLGYLAEQRGDMDAAAQAWKNAALHMQAGD